MGDDEWQNQDTPCLWFGSWQRLPQWLRWRRNKKDCSRAAIDNSNEGISPGVAQVSGRGGGRFCTKDELLGSEVPALAARSPRRRSEVPAQRRCLLIANI